MRAFTRYTLINLTPNRSAQSFRFISVNRASSSSVGIIPVTMLSSRLCKAIFDLCCVYESIARYRAGFRKQFHPRNARKRRVRRSYTLHFHCSHCSNMRSEFIAEETLGSWIRLSMWRAWESLKKSGEDWTQIFSYAKLRQTIRFSLFHRHIVGATFEDIQLQQTCRVSIKVNKKKETEQVRFQVHLQT